MPSWAASWLCFCFVPDVVSLRKDEQNASQLGSAVPEPRELFGSDWRQKGEHGPPADVDRGVLTHRFNAIKSRIGTAPAFYGSV